MSAIDEALLKADVPQVEVVSGKLDDAPAAGSIFLGLGAGREALAIEPMAKRAMSVEASAAPRLCHPGPACPSREGSED